MKKSFRRRLRMGFTLSELAVVTALVTSIPSASYVRAKKKAYEAKCIQNLRSIGQALQMHVMENGSYPKAKFYPKNPSKDPDSIRVILAGQGAGDARLWCCPGLPPKLQQKGLTFLYNDKLAGRNAGGDPSKTWVIIEFSCVSKKAPFPHPGGFNILMGDGSVKTTSKLPKELSAIRKAEIKRIQTELREMYACDSCGH